VVCDGPGFVGLVGFGGCVGCGRLVLVGVLLATSEGEVAAGKDALPPGVALRGVVVTGRVVGTRVVEVGGLDVGTVPMVVGSGVEPVVEDEVCGGLAGGASLISALAAASPTIASAPTDAPTAATRAVALGGLACLPLTGALTPRRDRGQHGPRAAAPCKPRPA
jgi:hypothetical protein